MYLNEQPEFARLLNDLCIAVDRPFDKDLLRVFWEDLKDIPFAKVQAQVVIVRRKGDKRFKSSDLRPPAETDVTPLCGYDNHVIVDKINTYALRHIWPRLSMLQRLYKHAWVYTRDKAAPRCVALKIEPDREEKMIDGELRVIEYPGHYLRLEDCDEAFGPTRENVPLQSREAPQIGDEGWNDADAATALLNRKV